MVTLRPYPRGFVVFRRNAPPLLPVEWSILPLGQSEWVFAHDSHLAPELVILGDGDRWVLVHGLCLYAGDDERVLTPARRIAEAVISGNSTFLDLLDVLGGRHVILVGDDQAVAAGVQFGATATLNKRRTTATQPAAGIPSATVER